MSTALKDKVVYQLLALWTGREEEWLTYKEIVSKLKASGVSERTIARYLSALVRDRKLMKEERGYKNTFYRPYDQFLHMLSLSRSWFKISEEYMCQMIREIIINRIEKSIIDSREASERINDLIVKEMDRIPKKNLTDDEISSQAFTNVFSRERLTELESKGLTFRIERFLLEAFYRPFSSLDMCILMEPPLLLSNVEKDIRLLLSSYMDLWSYIHEHPGASLEFEKYIKEKFPRIDSIEKMN